MTTSASRTLEDVIREAGEGWLLDRLPPPGGALQTLREKLNAIQQEARSRLHDSTLAPSEDVLVREYQTNPSQVRAFLQSLGGSRTPVMLLMAWRVVQGLSITKVEMDYQEGVSFFMKVVLRSDDGTEDPPYESRDISDFALFRHLGILKIDDNPVLNGFYALRLIES